MKKFYLTVGVVLALCASMGLSSCIGSFALTNKVISWNNQVGSKFVNELVFFAFWILPVYEVTALADVLIINSIEFWSGNNPVSASTKVIDTESGRYMVMCDGKGYTVRNASTGEETRLNFDSEDQTWAIEINGQDVPFMTFVDANHVKMLSPAGDFKTIELSEQGVMAYSAEVRTAALMAAR